MNGNFVEVTSTSLNEEPHTETTAVVWIDINRDGRFDLIVGNQIEPNCVLHNQGSGRFEVVQNTPLSREPRYSRAASWGDFDGLGQVSNRRPHQSPLMHGISDRRLSA